MKSTVLIIFGATGDLMAKKITPALYSLFKTGQLPAKFRVVGFARRDFNGDKFKELLEENLTKYLKIKAKDIDNEFYKIFTYQQGQLDDLNDYLSLKNKLELIDKDFQEISKKFFYFSVAPEFFEVITNNIANQKLNSINNSLIIEKPFGSSRNTAIELDKILKRSFSEEQIFRIDHYLGKDMINQIPKNFSDILPLKYQLKNYNNIKSIRISTLEELGVEARGDFYDKLGTLRDVGQNHLLEIIALLFLDNNNKDNIQNSRSKIIKSLKKYNKEEVNKFTFRAQYEGYKKILNVSLNSKTETYFKLISFLELLKFKKIQIILEAGKRSGITRKEIIVKYIHGESLIYNFGEKRKLTLLDDNKNLLTEKIFDNKNNLQYVGEYAELLKNAIDYEKENFVGIEEVLAGWEFVDSIEEGWMKDNPKLEIYTPDNFSIVKIADKALKIE